MLHALHGFAEQFNRTGRFACENVGLQDYREDLVRSGIGLEDDAPHAELVEYFL